MIPTNLPVRTRITATLLFLATMSGVASAAIDLRQEASAWGRFVVPTLLACAMAAFLWWYFDRLAGGRFRISRKLATEDTVVCAAAATRGVMASMGAQLEQSESSERNFQKREIERLNRLYSTLSAINRAIIVVHSREEMFQEVCQIAAQHVGFDLVWVGWHDPVSHRVVPVAQGGRGQDYVTKIKAYADDRPEGHGPAGTCIREGKPSIFNDFMNDPRARPWNEAARVYGLRAAAALPIRFNGKVIGALIVYTGEEKIFRDEEIALLDEIAASVSFALDHLEQERKRRQSEASLREREAQYRAVIETTPDGFYVSDGEGRFLEINDAYLRLSGYSRRELLGMRIADVDAMETPAVAALHIERIRQNGSDIFESRHRTKEGTEFLVEVNVAYWPGAGGRFFSFVRDITERKLHDEKLRRSESLLAEAQQLAHIGSWSLDLATNSLAWSDEQYRIFGLRPQESPMSAERVFSLMHPDDQAMVQQRVKQAVRDGQPYQCRFRAVHGDGTMRVVQSRGQSVCDDFGNPVRMIGTSQDVTEQSRARPRSRKVNDGSRQCS